MPVLDNNGNIIPSDDDIYTIQVLSNVNQQEENDNISLDEPPPAPVLQHTGHHYGIIYYGSIFNNNHDLPTDEHQQQNNPVQNNAVAGL